MQHDFEIESFFNREPSVGHLTIRYSTYLIPMHRLAWLLYVNENCISNAKICNVTSMQPRGRYACVLVHLLCACVYTLWNYIDEQV